jgi:ribosome hibernation promoting factor
MTNKTKVASEPSAYNITIIGRNVAITESMKQYAREKISKIERFSHRIIDVVVTMDIVKLEHRVDIVLNVEHTKIKVGAVGEEMYACIDKACDRLQRKLRQYRTRLRDHHAKGLSVIDMNVNVVEAPADIIDEVNDAIIEENLNEIEEALKPHQVVSRESRPLKTLTVEEAIMKMELSQDRFMVFRHERDQRLKVIYRRTDGNYGVIEPE